MKRQVAFFTGMAAYIAAVILLSGYGNVYVHREFNSNILKGFVEKFTGSETALEKFKYYSFDLDGGKQLSGPAVTNGGLIQAQESEKKYYMDKWIEEGGYSADEPELPASFRHFYDPTQAPGDRYLKDHLEYLENKLGGYIQFNPRIDQLDWAVGHPDNNWSWNNGIAYVKAALETSNEDERGANMAKAYRCLGSTLHMIADFGCPAHVRDDSHPAPFEDYAVISYFGSPDPYEELFNNIYGDIHDWADNSVDENLSSYFRSANRVEKIAHKMAVYTNENFFTNQTLSGYGVMPQIHPEKTYPYPNLDQCTYHQPSYTFRKMISGREVLMCKDLAYFWYVIPDRGYPYIDFDCVRSQGEALVPQIVEAGANAIRLFIPELEVKITTFNGGYITGTVTHKTDSVYTEPIIYRGKVDIFRADNDEKIGSVNAAAGSFEGDLNVPNETVLYAMITFGNISVKSPDFTGGKYSYFTVKFGASDDNSAIIQLRNGDYHTSIINFQWVQNNIPGKMQPLVWNGDQFSFEWNLGDVNILHAAVTGELESGTNLLKNMHTESSHYFYEQELDLQNIPLTFTGYGLQFTLEGSQVQSLISNIYYQDLPYGGLIESIDWSKTKLFVEFY